MTSLRERVRAGKTLDDLLVVDAHGHLGRWHAFHLPNGDAEGMIRTMDRLGINACIASGLAGIGPDFVLGNDEADRAAAAFPGRIFGYIAVNPNYPAGDMRRELEQRWATERFLGVKLHADMHQHPSDGPGYAPAWEFADERELPVLCHDAVLHLAQPAERYGRAQVVVAHALSAPEQMQAALELAARRPNVHLDLTGSPLLFGALELAVEKVGAGRILFGTDMTFLDPRPQLGRVAFAQITEADKLRILGRNAAELFRFDPDHVPPPGGSNE
jgi:predicted TIM-barrel fold metal-dependent hydrolase